MMADDLHDEHDAELRARLRQFALAPTPTPDATLLAARRHWNQDSAGPVWRWVLPYIAAASLLIDVAATHWMEHARHAEAASPSAAATVVDTALPGFAAPPVHSDPTIRLSMLETHQDVLP